MGCLSRPNKLQSSASLFKLPQMAEWVHVYAKGNTFNWTVQLCARHAAEVTSTQLACWRDRWFQRTECCLMRRSLRRRRRAIPWGGIVSTVAFLNVSFSKWIFISSWVKCKLNRFNIVRLGLKQCSMSMKAEFVCKLGLLQLSSWHTWCHASMKGSCLRKFNGWVRATQILIHYTAQYFHTSDKSSKFHVSNVSCSLLSSWCIANLTIRFSQFKEGIVKSA